jgi:hypothetical protein
VGDAENVTLVCAASKCILEIFDKNRTNLLLYCSCRTVSTCVMTAPISSQVDEEGLVDTLRKFLTEDSYLDERRAAAEGALRAAASGVTIRVWELLESCILKKALSINELWVVHEQLLASG